MNREELFALLDRVGDWVFRVAFLGLAVFLGILGVLLVWQLIPPVDFSTSQTFGLVLVVAAWMVLEIEKSFRRVKRGEAGDE